MTLQPVTAVPVGWYYELEHRVVAMKPPEHQAVPGKMSVVFVWGINPGDDFSKLVDELMCWINCPKTLKVARLMKTCETLYLERGKLKPDEGFDFYFREDPNPLQASVQVKSLDPGAEVIIVRGQVVKKESQEQSRDMSSVTPAPVKQLLSGSSSSQHIGHTIPELATKADPYITRNDQLSLSNIPQFNGATSQLENAVSVKREPGQPFPSPALLNQPPPPALLNQPPQQPPKPVRTVDLQPLFEKASLELLERGVEKGKAIIEKLEQALAPNRQPAQSEIKVWYEQLEGLKAKAAQQKTIIGVVGNTGAGKSSVINALLDEERLVPTNCMRACTAVVTEISYNHETKDPYRASIEFIEFKDWEDELRMLFADLRDGGDLGKDSDAGIALAKIRAVFPKKTKDEILKSSPETLLADPTVKALLGSTKKFTETDSLRFYRKLQTYVDSKEKTGKKGEESKTQQQMEFWPLIKVVKLYVKADVLSTGAIIVDLPGVHDANAARAGVAEGYMKNCTGLWIVAPITRAVDDKTAKTLLGQTFRRQLLMDGGFTSVTFICSKSDDISVSEATLSLNLEEDLQDRNARLEELEKKIEELKDKALELQHAKAVYVDLQDALNEEMETWVDLKDMAGEGKQVFKPIADKRNKKISDAKKRKKSGTLNNPKPKRARREDEVIEISDNEGQAEVEEQDTLDLNDSSDKENSQESPLTLEEIDSKISELQKALKKARQDKRELLDKIGEVKETLSEAKAQHQKLQKEIATFCIGARNGYSTEAIKQDFASGLRELDMEAEEARDPDNFDPRQNLRDYEAIANELPVFCVSSRGYQKLKGRLRRDGDPPVFSDIGETGMPQLQQHCKKQTEKAREHGSRKFLDSLSLMINSLSLWTSQASQGSGLKLDNRIFELLEEVLDGVISDTAKNLKTALKENLYGRFSLGVDDAVELATPTAESWGSPYRAGGIHWSTYRAICRRNGVYTNHRGLFDFNIQLSDPLIKKIAGDWERTFSRAVPQVIGTYLTACKHAFHTVHRQVQEQAAADERVPLGLLELLQRQLSNYELLAKAAADEAVALVTTMQREVNREFGPVIMHLMLPAYEFCNSQQGTGCYARMKAGMVEHVTENRRKMFEAATGHVKTRLEEMVKQVQGKMRTATEKMYELVRRDYMVLGNGNYLDSIGGRRKDVFEEVKREVESVLGEVENEFRKMLELEGETIQGEYEEGGEEEGEEFDDEEEVEEEAERGYDYWEHESDCDRDDDDDDDGKGEGDSDDEDEDEDEDYHGL